MKLTAIVLAAGESRRMGRQKLLLPYGGSTVIARVVDELIAGPVDSIVVVTGATSDGVKNALARREVQFAHNVSYAQGMLSSVRCGLEAAQIDTDAFLVALGDHPEMRSGHVTALVNAYGKNKSSIAIPVFEGKRGHPLLFSARHRQAVLTRYDNVGLRGLLREYAGQVIEVAMTDPGVTYDLDTPDDYAAALIRLRNEP